MSNANDSKRLKLAKLVDRLFTNVDNVPTSLKIPSNGLPDNKFNNGYISPKLNEIISVNNNKEDSLSSAHLFESLNSHAKLKSIEIKLNDKNKLSRRKQQKTRKFIEEDCNEWNDNDVENRISIDALAPTQSEQKDIVSTGVQDNVILDDETFVIPEGTVMVEPVSTDISCIIDEKVKPPKRHLKAKADLLNSLIHCTACNKQIGVDGSFELFRHPILKVLICKKCYALCLNVTIERDDDGSDELCRWCLEGGELVCCDFCHNAFCKTCIRRNLGRRELGLILDSEENAKWKCYVCEPSLLAPAINNCTTILEEFAKQEAEAELKRKKTLKSKLNTQRSVISKPAFIFDSKLLVADRVSVTPSINSSISRINVPNIKAYETTYNMSTNLSLIIERLMSSTHSMHMFLVALKRDLNKKSTSPSIQRVASIQMSKKLKNANLAFERTFEQIAKNIFLMSNKPGTVATNGLPKLSTQLASHSKKQFQNFEDVAQFLPSHSKFLLINGAKNDGFTIKFAENKFGKVAAKVETESNDVIELSDSDEGDDTANVQQTNVGKGVKRKLPKQISGSSIKKNCQAMPGKMSSLSVAVANRPSAYQNKTDVPSSVTSDELISQSTEDDFIILDVAGNNDTKSYYIASDNDSKRHSVAETNAPKNISQQLRNINKIKPPIKSVLRRNSTIKSVSKLNSPAQNSSKKIENVPAESQSTSDGRLPTPNQSLDIVINDVLNVEKRALYSSPTSIAHAPADAAIYVEENVTVEFSDGDDEIARKDCGETSIETVVGVGSSLDCFPRVDDLGAPSSFLVSQLKCT